MNKAKLYVLMAHRAEFPYSEPPKFGMETEYIFFGIGKKAAIDAAKDLSERIAKEKKECRVLLVGSCGSFIHERGFLIFDNQMGPLRYADSSCVHTLKTVDRLITPDNLDDRDWLSKYDAFDMEAEHFFDNFDVSIPYVMDVSVIKVVSDAGAKSMKEWEKAVKKIHSYLELVIKSYAEWDCDEGVQSSVSAYPNFPKEGVNFVDVFPAFTHRNLNRFSEWLNNEMEATLMLCPESRGLMLGAAVAATCEAAYIIPVRKANKLPGELIKFNAVSEYGVDELAVSVAHLDKAVDYCDMYGYSDDIEVVIVDDVLATGGTAEAIYSALHGMPVKTSYGAKTVQVRGFYFFTQIDGLGGAELLQRHGVPVKVFMTL